VNSSVRPKAAAARRRSTRRARRQAISEFRCGSILAAARTVFARHGFAAASVDRIAREAGVAKGTLYLYYSSKAAIYSQAVIAGLHELAAETLDSLSADVPLAHKLRRLFEMRLRYFAERADFFRIYNAELGNLGQAAGPIRQEYRRLFDQQVDRLEAELRGAMRTGAVRKLNARQVALAVLDLSHGIVQRRLEAPAGRAAEDIDAVLTVLLRGIEKP